MDDIERSFATICEMLQDRLENNPDPEAQAIIDSLREITGEALKAEAENSSSFSLTVGKKLRIIYFLQRFKSQDMISAINKDKNDKDKLGYEHYIIVLKDKSTSTSTKSILERLKGAEVEIFEIKELIFNISKHTLVPKHTLIKDEVIIRNLFEDLHIENKIQLPLILKTDPMARYLNAKPGNILKIVRYPITSAEHIVYRAVV